MNLGEPLVRGVGLRGALAVNVISMIGIGPLITIPLVLGSLHGPLSLVAWLLGALLALCDGLVWAELGSAYPRSGGTYGYLLEIFGPLRIGRLLAFLFVWETIFIIPLTLASGYIGFANYAGYLVPSLGSSPLALKLVAAAVGVITIFALYRGIKTIERVSVLLWGVAVLTLLAVIAAAFAHWSAHLAFAFRSAPSMWGGLRAGLGPALVVAMYDYIGYNQANTIAGEVVEPQRTLPRSIVGAILLVGALYIAMQIGVLGAIPWQRYVPLADGSLPPLGQHLASAVVERAFGPAAGIFVTILILITAFASVYGLLLGSSRIPYAAALDGLFLRPFAHLHERHRFPDVSLVVMGAIALIASFFTLDQVISALIAAIVLVQSVAQIVALFVMRAQGVRAPYRMWLYPLPAIVALAAWVYVFCSAGSSAIVFGLVSIAAGAVVYVATRRAAP
ncbi:MAG TPA: APC family permease [Candidatus Baltobacteraceae bacterium]|nr:APC family permease [Candidatus Baltobacteraceae bacterium]